MGGLRHGQDMFRERRQLINSIFVKILLEAKVIDVADRPTPKQWLDDVDGQFVTP
jgi:hypothetical protein